MKGTLKNSRSGQQIENSPKSELATEPADTSRPLPPTEHDLRLEPPDTDFSLAAVLDSVNADAERWPQEALKAVLKRKNRMPRKGWEQARKTFSEKFSLEILSDEFQKRAKRVMIAASGRPCTAREFREEARRNSATVEQLLDQNTLRETKIATEVKTLFGKIYKDLCNKQISGSCRTRKIYSEYINELVLTAVIRAADEVVKEKTPSTMTEAARVLQAVQITYEDYTKISKPVSTWKDNILKKTAELTRRADILERAKHLERLNESEKIQARKWMREMGLLLCHHGHVVRAVANLRDRAAVYEKKVDIYKRRCEYRNTNQKFELNRRKFYRDLEQGQSQHEVSMECIKDFWCKMWEINTDTTQSFEKYIPEHVPPRESASTFPSLEEFERIIAWLPSWKAAGNDGVFNFFIKKCTPLHGPLYEITKRICLDGATEEDWFYRGLTYLIPKGKPEKGSDFRPITCMSNLYKLVTKCVTLVAQLLVEERGLLSQNQLGTVRMVEGAKELALTNFAINSEYNNKLKVAWIDVRKAFDSVDHSYLLKCIKSLNLPDWLGNFVQGIIGKWRLEIRCGQEVVLEKSIKRGIIQGDSLSPLLFVLCMDPLSRSLNNDFPVLEIKTAGDSGYFTTNHFLFIDDLKLLAQDCATLKKMMDRTQDFMAAVGLEINQEKSVTNAPTLSESATLLE